MRLRNKIQQTLILVLFAGLGLASSCIGAATIHGQVSDEVTGEAVSETYVFFFDIENRRSWGSALTSATGYFQVNNIPAGSYKVEANTLNNGNYIPELYEETVCLYDRCDIFESGTTVVLNIGETRVIDFQLSPKGSVHGRITDQRTGLPLEGIQLEFEDPSITHDFITSWFSAFTDSNGEFSVDKVIPGNYFLTLDGTYSQSSGFGYPEMLYPNIYCAVSSCIPSEDAIPITVDSNEDTEFSVALKKGGTVRGKVLDARTGLPLMIDPYDIHPVELKTNPLSYFSQRAYLDENSEFQFAALVPDDYYIYVELEHHPTSFIPEWYLDTFEPDQATPISLNFYEEVDISMSLDTPGMISGRVIDENSQAGIAKARVIFYKMPDLTEKTTLQTDESGYFQVELLAGAYQVRTNVPTLDYTTELYVPEVWDDIYCTTFDCTKELEIGTPFVVQNSTVIDNIEIALNRTATISGHVTDQDTGIKIESVSVNARDINTSHYFSDSFTDGNFQITGLLPGTYEIWTDTSSGDYLDEFYDNFLIWERAGEFTPFVVDVDATYQLNFELVAAPFVHGRIIDEQTLEPLLRAEVRLYDLDNNFVGGAITDENGDYELHYLEGNYKLLFWHRGYVVERFNDVQCNTSKYPDKKNRCLELPNPDLVKLSFEAPFAADAQLTRGSRIHGVVTDEETGEPIPGIMHWLYDSEGVLQEGGYFETDATGAYSFN
ncbi:MAG: hypothetical protein DRQ58_11685, partial [Gammaproteobacteria bacterium]